MTSVVKSTTIGSSILLQGKKKKKEKQQPAGNMYVRQPRSIQCNFALDQNIDNQDKLGIKTFLKKNKRKRLLHQTYKN